MILGTYTHIRSNRRVICENLTIQQSVLDCPSLTQKKRRVRWDQWKVKHGAKPIKVQEEDELPQTSFSSLSPSQSPPRTPAGGRMKRSAGAAAVTSAEAAQQAAATAAGIRYALWVTSLNRSQACHKTTFDPRFCFFTVGPGTRCSMARQPIGACSVG